MGCWKSIGFFHFPSAVDPKNLLQIRPHLFELSGLYTQINKSMNGYGWKQPSLSSKVNRTGLTFGELGGCYSAAECRAANWRQYTTLFGYYWRIWQKCILFQEVTCCADSLGQFVRVEVTLVMCCFYTINIPFHPTCWRWSLQQLNRLVFIRCTSK